MRGSPPELAQVPSVSTPQPIPETHGPVSVIRGWGMTDPQESLQSIRQRMLLAVAGLVAFVSGAPDTWAFTTQPVTSDTMSNRLADPDQLPDKTSKGQSGGTTFGVPGGHLMLQFSAPPSSGTSNSPFVSSPNSAFVPSEHR